MLLYRIARKAFALDFNGTGARLYGGRWNSVGQSMVYFAASRSLAVLEVLVHLQSTTIPIDFMIVTVDVPEDFEQIKTTLLPDNWNAVSPQLMLKHYGDDFIREGRNLLLKVPSVIVQQEYNYLLNPLHKKASSLKVIEKEPFSFDARLI